MQTQHFAQFAVFGQPVAHSKSPRIHRLFAAQQGQDIDYRALALPANEADFRTGMDAFFGAGALGANVTVPFKEWACRYADELSDRARAAGAVNTFIRLPAQPESGKAWRVRGDNTDGAGLVRDLADNLGVALEGRRILVIGAGGAARGIVLPLLQVQPESVLIANRSPERAQALADEFAVEVLPLNALAGRRFDIVINATSGSLKGEAPAVPADIFSGCLLAYDLVYAAQPTPFMRQALENGAAAAADGLGMLVEQAAESYFLWRGFRADTAPVIAALREELSQ